MSGRPASRSDPPPAPPRPPLARLRAPYGRGCALAAAGLAAALALGGGAFGDPRAERPPADDAGAIRLLRAAADAARRVPYQGKRFLTVWGATATTAAAAVAHIPGRGTLYGAMLRPDGPAAADPPTGRVLAALLRNYTVLRGADTGVLGRAAHLVEAHRHGGGVAGRFWLDAATGLLLRRELLDARGRQVAESGFTELVVGPAAAPPRGVPDASALWPTALDRAARTALRGDGWPVPEELPGRLRLFDARRAPDGTVHLGFSDGLAAVSVFVQRGRTDRSALPGWRPARHGILVRDDDLLRHWAITSSNGYVVTVVTEAPASTAVAVAARLRPRRDAVTARLGRGVRRLGSWLNPFD
ncbi:sigma-E factor regulatory protein RseB domain-containing protein [Actinomadura atramentaria]|uniref:sigma-E factor regulatory protein RseB domain-containing protein n=1 Tax=Actinomadura atramentaria TaxID=1990 RepID=UPI000376268B|nr:sigma-E factor regulatory protein RseB domain-containing protein [Actinomadura atramentaria]